MSAPSDKKEDLLKELEHFAFRGIPNVNSPRPAAAGPPPSLGETTSQQQQEPSSEVDSVTGEDQDQDYEEDEKVKEGITNVVTVNKNGLL